VTRTFLPVKQCLLDADTRVVLARGCAGGWLVVVERGGRYERLFFSEAPDAEAAYFEHVDVLAPRAGDDPEERGRVRVADDVLVEEVFRAARRALPRQLTDAEIKAIFDEALADAGLPATVKE